MFQFLNRFNGGFLFNSTKNFVTFTSKIFIISFFLGAGLGCQSSLDIAGGEHKTVTEKWMALSKYAESNIENTKVTLSARLAISADKQFKLTHFKLNARLSRQDINLLAPNFEHKYICSPICYQLLEYVSFSGEGGNTLLTNYFDRHEFELFKFYGDIQLLNKELVKLAKHDQLLLNTYLEALAYQGASFNTAQEFIQFLTEVLTLPALERFGDNPEELLSYFLENFQGQNGNEWDKVNAEQNEWVDFSADDEGWTSVLKEQDEWADVSKEQDSWTDIGTEQNEWANVNKENDEWILSNEIPELAWSNEPDFLSEAIWLKEVKLPRNLEDGVKSTNNKTSDDNQLSWQSAKASPIRVGYNVCSYQESYFGVVSKISVDSVIVNLLGQARIINEGIVSPAHKGDLFSMNEELYFSPLAGKRSFKKSDVASCILE